jgi:hypothetical protein
MGFPVKEEDMGNLQRLEAACGLVAALVGFLHKPSSVAAGLCPARRTGATGTPQSPADKLGTP